MKQRTTVLRLAALLALCGVASAQQGTTEVRGQVSDPQGAVLAGVTVVIRNQDTGMFRETVSSPDGTCFASGIVPGMYEIQAELQGFKKYSRRDVRLETGKTATADLQLQVGSVEETVNVTADSPIVDVTSKEVGGSVSARELVELPSVNRNFVGFVGLLPGIIPSISTESFGSDSISVNGQDPSRSIHHPGSGREPQSQQVAVAGGIRAGQMDADRPPDRDARPSLRRRGRYLGGTRQSVVRQRGRLSRRHQQYPAARRSRV